MKLPVSKSLLIEATLHEWTHLAGNCPATWSRWFTGNRDLRINSLIAPAERLGITPGQLLDIILERRKRQKVKNRKTLQTLLYGDG